MKIILSKTLFLMVVASLILSTFFAMKMQMDLANNNGSCIFNTLASCPMNLQEHIDKLQQAFAARPETQSNVFSALLIILLPTLLIALERWYKLAFQNRNPEFKLFNYIISFYSSGIAEPKLYI